MGISKVRGVWSIMGLFGTLVILQIRFNIALTPGDTVPSIASL